MPYDIDKPEDLPEYVQDLPAKKQRQWIHVFNSARAKCKKEGGSDKKCESSAFAQANEAVKAGRRVRGLRVAQLRKLRQELEDLLGELNDVLGWAEYEDQQQGEGVAYGFPMGTEQAAKRDLRFKAADVAQTWEQVKKWLLEERLVLGRPKVNGVKFIIRWDGGAAELETEGEMPAPPTGELSGIQPFAAKGMATSQPLPHFWLYDIANMGETLPERLEALKALNLPEMFTVLAHRPIRDQQDLEAVGEWAVRRPHSTGIVIRSVRPRADQEVQDMDDIKTLLQLATDGLDQDEPYIEAVKKAIQDIKVQLGFEQKTEGDGGEIEPDPSPASDPAPEAESTATVQEEADAAKAASMSEKERRIRDAWYAKYRTAGGTDAEKVEKWVKDVFDDDVPTHLIVETPGGLLSYTYAFTADDEIEFGEPIKGELVFRPTGKTSPVAIKILREDDKGVEVGGHLLLWGDAETKDLAEEYFTPDTNLWLDAYKSVPCLFHHGLDAKVGLNVIGHRTKAVPDDIGVWVEHRLDKSKAYWAMVRPLLEAEGLYYSPGSASHLVECEEDGELKSFPVVEDTMTLIPCQHRLLPVEEIKAVYAAADIELPDALTTQQDDETNRAATLEIAELEQQLYDMEV